MIDIERIREVGTISIVKVHVPADPSKEFFLIDSYHRIHQLSSTECLIKEQTTTGYKDIVIPTKMITEITLKDVFEAIERFGIFDTEFVILGDITKTENYSEWARLINFTIRTMQYDTLIERTEKEIKEKNEMLEKYRQMRTSSINGAINRKRDVGLPY